MREVDGLVGGRVVGRSSQKKELVVKVVRKKKKIKKSPGRKIVNSQKKRKI